MVERHVVGITRRREALRSAGQPLKRGVLLHGPPGTGKTHTVRYLLGRLEDVTVVVLSGDALGAIGPACSIARALQPSVVVVEDVDLIAEQRGMHPGQHPLLFRLLNEMAPTPSLLCSTTSTSPPSPAGPPRSATMSPRCPLRSLPAPSATTKSPPPS